jgi:hypothetical protein
MYCCKREGAAVGGAFRGARGIQQLEGIAHQAPVAGHVKRYQGLYAGVSGILQLFVVRAIHVGFMGAKPGRAPTHFENLVELGRAGVEAGFALERITGVDAAQIVNNTPLVGEHIFSRLEMSRNDRPRNRMATRRPPRSSARSRGE